MIPVLGLRPLCCGLRELVAFTILLETYPSGKTSARPESDNVLHNFVSIHDSYSGVFSVRCARLGITLPSVR